jgi:hypothetical protein
MKKINISLILCIFGVLFSFAQVGIGASDPYQRAALELRVYRQGMLFPRMTTTERNAITSPAKGLTIFNTTLDCLQTNTGTPVLPNWDCFIAPPPTITDLTCGSATFSPTTITESTAYTGTVTVPYTGGKGVVYSAGSAIASTGVTGLTATLVAGTLTGGAGNLTYNVSGTAAADGTASFALNFGGQSCSISNTVDALLPDIGGLTCGSATFSPTTITESTAYTGTVTVPYTGGNGADYSAGSAIASTGVTGLTATLVAGTLTGGAGNLTYNVSGTAASNGTASFALNFGGQSCSLDATIVGNGDATFSLPQTHTVMSSFYSGPPAINIQGVVDNSTNQIIFTVPYTGGTGNYDAYTSSLVTVVGQSSDTNNLTISYPAGTFATSGNLAVTVTVDGDGTFNVAKQGQNITATFATLDLQVNGNSKGNLLIDAAGGIPDKKYGDGVHDFIYLAVTNTYTGETWLNHNLGAHYTNVNDAAFDPGQQATARDDYKAYGSLFQWGRDSDGHEILNWISSTDTDNTESLTTIYANTDTPGHDDFIMRQSFDYTAFDWRDPSNNNRWAIGANNPCPTGYSLPTDTELNAERLSWVQAPISSTNTSTGAYASPLKLSSVGKSNGTSLFGFFYAAGLGCNYWSSTIASNLPQQLSANGSSSSVANGSKFDGASVRCIKD